MAPAGSLQEPPASYAPSLAAVPPNTLAMQAGHHLGTCFGMQECCQGPSPSQGFPCTTPGTPQGRALCCPGPLGRKEQKQLETPEHKLCFSLLPQQRAPGSQGQCKPSTPSSRGSPLQEPLSRPVWLDNQLGQDSQPCPVSSFPAAQLGSLSPQQIPLPAQCKFEHSPESRPGEPRSASPAPEAAEKQKYLGNTAAETGNQPGDDAAKCVLTERTKPPVGARHPPHCSNSGSQVCETGGTRCSRGGDPSDAAKTTPKSSMTHTLKEVQGQVGLDPQSMENASQGFSEIASETVSPSSGRNKGCDQGLEGAGTLLCRALAPEPKAGVAPRGRCPLIIIAVEQKGLHATRRRAGPPPEMWSCELLEGRPGPPEGARVAPSGPPAAGTPQTRGWECGQPEACSPGRDNGALQQVAWAPWSRGDTCSQEPAGDKLSAEETAEEKLPGKQQSSRTGADAGGIAGAPGPGPEDTCVECPGARDGGAPEGEAALALSPRAHLLQQASQEPEPLQLGAGALGAEDKQEHGADKRTAPVASRKGPSGQTPVQPLHHVLSVPQILPHSPGTGAAGRAGGTDTETLRDPGGTRPSAESWDIKRPLTPEKRLGSRLAIAHKTFASFFESKVVGSPQGSKEQSRRPQNSWRGLLKSKGARGSQTPSLVSPAPSPEILTSLEPAPGTSNLCEMQAKDEGNHAVRGLWAPPSSPSRVVCPDSRSKTEPTVHCPSPQDGGRPLCAHGNQGMPSKPSGPKPQSLRPGAQWAGFLGPGRGSVGSLVFLGSNSHVRRSEGPPKRPRTRQASASHLLSLQTLDQIDPKESWERGQCPLRRHLSMVPLLRDLPGSERWRQTATTSLGPSRLPRRSCPLSRSAPTGLNRVGWPEHRPDPALPDGVLDVAVRADKAGSEEDLYEGGHSPGHHYSQPGGGGEQLAINELISDGSVVCAEALWDHVTMDDQELGFKAGDVVEVMDATHREWWWGRVADGEGWFPANFVRLRVNQDEPQDEDKAQRVGATQTEEGGVGVQSSGRDQMRTNVIREILSTERDYIQHLHDICEGYLRQCRRRADMFSEEQLRTIFGNIEDIYQCHTAFARALEQRFNQECPHLSELGACFLEHQAQFQIYSDYCNNHADACLELSRLTRLSKYTYFFEACRLLQKMIDISLDGFLLTPVQKICQYPLQLAELLKYTHPQHRDFKDVEAALDAMKKVARLINERKRRLENVDKIAQWQSSVEGWEGEDLLARSSELIHSGELTLVTQPQARSRQRMLFLFDHQLVFCKKDLLRRDVLYYKGRVDLGTLQVEDCEDKDRIKNAFRLRCSATGESHLLCTKKPEQKQRWLQAFAREREQVRLDQETGFSISELQKKQATLKASKMQAAAKSKALGRPYHYTRQKPRGPSGSTPQQPTPVLAEPRRTPSAFWRSVSRLAPFRK